MVADRRPEPEPAPEEEPKPRRWDLLVPPGMMVNLTDRPIAIDADGNIADGRWLSREELKALGIED
jgi:hypothetical protein